MHWDEKPEKYRWWQDACLAVFPGENALFTALTSTWKLHGRLRDHHEKQRLGWQFGLYATICVGTSFAAALPCLPYARRGETAIHADIADRLTPQLRQLLLAAGLRYGPASSESSSPTAIGVTGDLTCDCAE
ncbi:hypothetical protein HY501_00540 [Candidatus Woesearchaeota archaeon]|nr:hypothetical protein [Candidatus Woesearchaeota archaeon]